MIALNLHNDAQVLNQEDQELPCDDLDFYRLGSAV